ncbi:acyltransferase family protein [Burkholderia perseverans]|uniref:acyltransferase family protein n=1 Tax=Burkholderia perseverans TaxID=2615214 RepID=UPI001FEDAFBC|nr:acyltransferase [Burkholderia perseverans]
MNTSSVAPKVTAKGDRLPALPSLTGFRFIVSLLVFLFHVSVANSPIPPYKPVNPFGDPQIATHFSYALAQMGYIGVSYFFVLTGFIITWSSFPFGESKLSFWRRRIVKIYPNHVVIFILALGLFSWNYTSFDIAIKNLLLVHAFFPQPNVSVSVNPPSWSLCADILFYLAFPFLIKLVAPLRARGLWLAVAATALVILLIPVVNDEYVVNYPKSPITPISATQFWFGYLFPLSRMFDFVLGVVLARIVMLGIWPRIGFWRAVLLVVVSVVVAKFLPFIYSLDAVSIIPIAVLICEISADDLKGDGIAFIKSKFMQRLGDMSFGFYICQGITVFYLRTLVTGTYGVTESILLIAASFVATLFGGWVLYAGVERPAMRHWGRSRKRGRAEIKTEITQSQSS